MSKQRKQLMELAGEVFAAAQLKPNEKKKNAVYRVAETLESFVHSLDNPCCPECGAGMIFMPGHGWDLDRWVCGSVGCYGEIEIEIDNADGEGNLW